MAFTKKQKAAVKAIVSCHETGKAVGNYSALVVLPDDAGITYGCHQATHKAGSLYAVVKQYCGTSTSENAEILRKYLPELKDPAKRHKLAKDAVLKRVLKKAGGEREMQIAQDKVFENIYFKPALRAVIDSNWKHALSLAVVYDSFIHGSWARLRDKVKGKNEKEWIAEYVAVRRKWLSSSKRPILRKTVYRMATFEKLMKEGNWELELPITAHGVKITQAHLDVWINAMPEADEAFKETPVRQTKVKKSPPAPVVEASEPTALEVLTQEPAVSPVEQEVEQIKAEPLSGWKTWTTTITGTLSTLGVSASAFLSWYWGAITDPQSAYFVMLITVTGFAAAALILITYMITRAIKQGRREKHALALTLKEMEIKANPQLGNVTVRKIEV